jgi:hypothetical protein
MERGTVLHDGAPKTMTLCEIIHFQSETLTVDVATKNSDLNSSLPGRSECMSFSFDGVLMAVVDFEISNTSRLAVNRQSFASTIQNSANRTDRPLRRFHHLLSQLSASQLCF